MDKVDLTSNTPTEEEQTIPAQESELESRRASLPPKGTETIPTGEPKVVNQQKPPSPSPSLASSVPTSNASENDKVHQLLQ